MGVHPLTPSRRRLLQAAGLSAVAVPLAHGAVIRAPRARAADGDTSTVVLRGTATGTGTYAYHPFEVPPGTRRVDVSLVKTGGAGDEAKTGLGLFDTRGAHYATLERPNGFRGIYGEERSAAWVAADGAAQAFLPGPVLPGTWTVVVPVFRAPAPTPYEITVTLTAGPAGAVLLPGPGVGVVVDAPDWYRGDLHCHTPESSDAFASGSALTAAQWAETCRQIGLDYVALTDHNVVSQNLALADSAGEGVLLLGGEEMTNWFHGHATVSGIEPGEWFDWRQRPAGVPLDPDHESTVQEFLRAVRASGAFVAAAHPLGAQLTWQFLGEAAADPTARTDSLEVWTGPFQPDDEAAVKAWDEALVQGQRVVANGGSDLHGTENSNGFVAGTPTTVVHAERLAKAEVLDALRAGRSFVTRLPDGVEVYLSGTAPSDQRQITGGTLHGDAGETAVLSARVRRAAGMRLVWVVGGAAVRTDPLSGHDEARELEVPLGTDSYVRVEVRGEPFLDTTSITASRLDMEALSNPVWLAPGPVPPGMTRDDTDAPAEPGPRRSRGEPAPVVPEAGATALLPVTGLAAAGAVVGAGALAARAAGRRAAGAPEVVTPEAITAEELRHLAAAQHPSVRGAVVTVRGRVAGLLPARLVSGRRRLLRGAGRAPRRRRRRRPPPAGRSRG